MKHLTIEEKKQYLSQVSKLKSELALLDEMRDELYKTPIQNITDMPKANTKPNIQEEKVCNFVDKEAWLLEEIERLQKMEEEILGKISNLKDSRCRQVLYRKYIMCEKIESIAKSLDQSIRTVTILHKKGIERM
jgi:hypothetical protein